ncbi:MAG TPA: hypothetical protein VH592_26580, partial [Gemmataceae bacterium]
MFRFAPGERAYLDRQGIVQEKNEASRFALTQPQLSRQLLGSRDDGNKRAQPRRQDARRPKTARLRDSADTESSESHAVSATSDRQDSLLDSEPRTQRSGV